MGVSWYPEYSIFSEKSDTNNIFYWKRENPFDGMPGEERSMSDEDVIKENKLIKIGKKSFWLDWLLPKKNSNKVNQKEADQLSCNQSVLI